MGECLEQRIHCWKTGASDSEIGLKGCPYCKIDVIVCETMLAGCLQYEVIPYM